jgi:hypothetical protein
MPALGIPPLPTVRVGTLVFLFGPAPWPGRAGHHDVRSDIRSNRS